MSESTIRMLGRAHIQGKIKLLSGLHIGAGKDTIEIGGIDNPVIKHPYTGVPYIPGSSLKGKLRFLLEWAFEPEFGSVRRDGLPWGADDDKKYQRFDADDPVLRIFGTAAKKGDWSVGPTRLIVRDCFPRKEWLDAVAGQPLTEEKPEVVIDRIAGKAHSNGPRFMERVPADAEFDMEMVFRLYDTGDGGARDRDCLNWLLAGLFLLEQDALGGSGSRGYGRVRFDDVRVVLPDGTEHDVGGTFRINRFDPASPPEIVTFPS